MRRKTRQVHVGNVMVGGDAPIAVQSMTTTYTRDVKSTVEQIHRLEDVGCEIVRVAVPEMEDAVVISDIKKQIRTLLSEALEASSLDAELGYFELVDRDRFDPIGDGQETRSRALAIGALRLGTLRLLDNVPVSAS